MFRFYHEEEYKRQVEKFQERKTEVEQDSDEGSIDENTGDEAETIYSGENISNASNRSDWTDAEPYEVDESEEPRDVEDENHITGFNEFVECELFDVHEEKGNEEGDAEGDIWKHGIDSEYKEPDLYDIEEEDEDEDVYGELQSKIRRLSMYTEFEDEGWENVFEEDDEKFLDERWESDQIMFDADEEACRDLLSSESIAAIAKDSKSLINKHLDITIATSGAIMTALANVSEHTQDVTRRYTSIAIAAVGIAVGMKGLFTAARPHQSTLPRCKSCKNIPHPNTGCKPFCHLCGECARSTYWKDGSIENHCLVICHRCDSNCVLCETNVATVKRHHTDFATSVHGDISTRLSGWCRNGGLLASSLLMVGVLTSAAAPTIGSKMGATLIAGMLILSPP